MLNEWVAGFVTIYISNTFHIGKVPKYSKGLAGPAGIVVLFLFNE
jgi:hypothetical protein